MEQIIARDEAIEKMAQHTATEWGIQYHYIPMFGGHALIMASIRREDDSLDVIYNLVVPDRPDRVLSTLDEVVRKAFQWKPLPSVTELNPGAGLAPRKR